VCITESKEELHLKYVHNEGKAEGLAPLFSFVPDGTIAMELAADRAQISLEECITKVRMHLSAIVEKADSQH